MSSFWKSVDSVRLFRSFRRATGMALMLPPLLVFVVFFVVPIVYLFVVSFLEPSQTELFGSHPTLENYTRVLGDAFYLRIIQRTLLAAILIVGISLAVGYPVAIWVARLPPRQRVLCMIVLLFPL